jgi:hypothetical protein
VAGAAGAVWAVAVIETLMTAPARKSANFGFKFVNLKFLQACFWLLVERPSKFEISWGFFSLACFAQDKFWLLVGMSITGESKNGSCL